MDCMHIVALRVCCHCTHQTPHKDTEWCRSMVPPNDGGGTRRRSQVAKVQPFKVSAKFGAHPFTQFGRHLEWPWHLSLEPFHHLFSSTMPVHCCHCHCHRSGQMNAGLITC